MLPYSSSHQSETDCVFLTWASLLGITGRGHSSNTPETQVFVFYKRSGIEAFVLLRIAKSDPNNIKVFYFTAE
jgi:hypothetical protein